MITSHPMFRRILVFVCFSLSPFLPFSISPSASARDFIRGPLVLSLSDKWTVSEEPGPELLKATLSSNPTASLSIWKYKPGAMSASQFLDGLRSDLGWTVLTAQAIIDSRFGKTNVGLYKKSGAYEELQFKIRSYDFVLDGDIYVLEMRVPQAQFDKSDTEFRAVFAGLSNLSGVTQKLEMGEEKGGRKEEETREDKLGETRLEPLAVPSSSAASVSLSPSLPSSLPPSYTFIYELPDGSRLGFDMPQNRATLHTRSGQIKTVFPVSGLPFLTSDGIYLLTDEYAYRLDPATGNISARLPAQDILQGRREALPAEGLSSPPPSSSPSPPAGVGDYLKSALDRAVQIRKNQGLKPALNYLMNEKTSAEQTHSPHLYEFYFRLGEYWEETGDLETALAYYRLATKAID